MYRILPLLIATIFLIACAAPGYCGSPKADVVVAGVISHGPMQPTVNAIKEVLSKYGDNVRVEWIDMDTPEGKKYFEEHGLTAHLNVIVNGKYTHNVNGKDVTFQWFEGKQWKKDDLDTLISGIIGGK